MSFYQNEIIIKNICTNISLKCNTDMGKKKLKMLTHCQHASLLLHRTK